MRFGGCWCGVFSDLSVYCVNNIVLVILLLFDVLRFDSWFAYTLVC